MENLISSFKTYLNKKNTSKSPLGPHHEALAPWIANPIAWESFARLIPPIVVAKKNLKKSYPQTVHTKLIYIFLQK
jgi:hypothetical protein